MMNSMAYSPFHWVVAFIVFLIVVIPTVKILRKAGYSGWWVLLWFIPVVNAIALWVFAFARWPLEDRAATQ
jgi:uncharacterized membrane protein YhaH (DUF805 family)